MGSAVSFNRRNESAVQEGNRRHLPVQSVAAEIGALVTPTKFDNAAVRSSTESREELDNFRFDDYNQVGVVENSPHRSHTSSPARPPSSRSNGSSQQASGESRRSASREMELYRRSQLSEANSPQDSDNAEMFACTAMSLGLDNDDLLFNMMFFDDGTVPNFGSMMNTLQQETLALHSEHNTPYKLNPANEAAVSALIHATFKRSTDEADNECAVCKDEIEDGADITRVPSCRHYFHTECLSKWIKLQSWCPVCRSSLETANSTTTCTSCTNEPTLSVISKLPTCLEMEEDGEAKFIDFDESIEGFGTPVRKLNFDSVVLDDSADEKSHNQPYYSDKLKSKMAVTNDAKVQSSKGTRDDLLQNDGCSVHHHLAHESAGKIINAALGRAVHREISCKD